LPIAAVMPTALPTARAAIRDFGFFAAFSQLELCG
jgi:hypothetical protein